MILLAKNLVGKKLPDQVILNGLDVEVHRNFFGSQMGSFLAPLTYKTSIKSEKRGVFIRAPIVSKVLSTDVEVLATLQRKDTNVSSIDGNDFTEVVVAIKQGSVLALSFHPELIGDDTWHRYFLDLVTDSKK